MTESNNSINKKDYWANRKDLVYYQHVKQLVNTVGAEAKSIIDIGSSNTSCIEWFEWIPHRVTLDKNRPYTSDNVQGIKVDFFNYTPESKYDLALCLQVLEHIPDAPAFARKLFNIAYSVIISVPFNWPEDDCKYHVHDPVDKGKLYLWTQRKPDYTVIATEKNDTSPKAKRLIAYYRAKV